MCCFSVCDCGISRPCFLYSDDGSVYVCVCVCVGSPGYHYNDTYSSGKCMLALNAMNCDFVTET